MRREERGKKGERREESGEESGGRSADSWPSRDGARERSPAGLERVGTFRRKLATTCSKGYLYTWCTSTVTPIPARSPRRSERGATRTLRGPQASKRQRPKGRGFSFSSSFKLPKLYCPLGETDRLSNSRPLPPTSSVGAPRAGRCPSGGARSGPALPGRACSASAAEPRRGILQPWTWGLVLLCHHLAWSNRVSLKPLSATLKSNKYVNYPPSEFRSSDISLRRSAEPSVTKASNIGVTRPGQLPLRLEVGSHVQ